MSSRNYRFGLTVAIRRFFRLLSRFWPVPFAFYEGPVRVTGKLPHPLAPRTIRDLVLNKMMFPDNADRAIIADKIAARGWVAERIGAEYLIPLYDICDTPEQLRLDEYPLPFVVKSNHASGQFHFVYTRQDIKGVIEKTRGWLRAEYNPEKEWVYRGIKRRLVVEKLLVDSRQNSVWEFKMLCLFGEPALVRSIVDLTNKPQNSFTTLVWEPLDIENGKDPTTPAPEKPKELAEILRISRALSADFDHIRVDLIICDGKVYFGELTNFPGAGVYMYLPNSYDAYLLEQYNRLREEKITNGRAGYHAAAEKMKEL